jgi:GNAT superfamily N-acetyltransferase
MTNDTPVISFMIDPDLSPHVVPDLRAAVGWERWDEDYRSARYWATVGGFDAGGELVAWCAVLSDGARHAVLLDVIVHPRVQRRGVGRALVARAVDHILAHGISIIHIDFVPKQAAFYERSGFRIGVGGIYEGMQPIKEGA